MKAKTWRNIIILGLLALLLFYVGYQLFVSLYRPYRTETVVGHAVTDSIPTKGLVVRDEQIIAAGGTGHNSYMVENGSRVSKGALVSKVYQNEEDAEKALKITELERMVALLKEASDPGVVAGQSIESLQRQIQTYIISLSGTLEGGNYDSLVSVASELLKLISTKQVASGKESDFTDKVTELEEQIAGISATISVSPVQVYAPDAGYFVSTTDGYESLVSIKNLSELTPQRLRELIETPPRAVEGACGKMVYGFEWKYVALINAQKGKSLKKGSKYMLEVPFSSIGKVPATVESIEELTDTGEVFVTFSCDYFTEELAGIRDANISVSLTNYDGLRISKEALKVVDGQTGVYIKQGNLALFKKVERILETDGYILVSLHQGDYSYLQQYDEVIVSGKDLYDQKLLS